MSRTLVGFMLMFALTLGGCGGSDDPFSQSEEPRPPATGPLGETITVRDEIAEVHSVEDVRGRDDVQVRMRNYLFDPTVIVGSPGQQIEVLLFNQSALAHTFTIEELDIDEELASGEQRTISLTFPESGTADIVCRFHLEQAMVGQLRVEEEDGAGS